MPSGKFEILNSKFKTKQKCGEFKFSVISNLIQILNFKFRIQPQTGSVQMILLVVLLIGVGIGTYLVQTRSQLFSQAASADKATIKNRSESVGSDGVKQITFTWSDGRTSYDFKGADGNLIKGRAYALRGSERSTPTGEQVQGNTYITTWSDGTVEYNVFTNGTYDQAKSYAAAGGSSNSKTTSTTTTSSKKTTTPEAQKNTTNNTSQTKTSTTTTATTAKTTTATTPQTTTTATTTTSTPTVSTTEARNILTQFQALETIFNDSIKNKIKVATASSPLNGEAQASIMDNIANAEASFVLGTRSAEKCIATPTTTCSASLSPLLNFSQVAVRIVAFSAISSGIPEICTRADFGISPIITVTSTTNLVGPLYLCSGANGKEKKWRIFDTNNVPQTLNSTDAAIWKPVTGEGLLMTDYPSKFQEKFNQAQELVKTTFDTTVLVP